ncbi:hypothetical protein IVA94_15000 [Bradyrhizobium sp. 156]|uniref:hypothetical protein n=1 Tax=Bradyrhizobium sp. 156 TaxID=2782630 RepID=UPI001FFB716A|nr:hypothetical protein [Bradyrhizobium sp. 156]MCK1322177.1 hypothetical protein [Bradyrhizobium sp. 156]
MSEALTGNRGEKEYLREVFRSSALDVTASYHTVLGFVRLFKGEPEAATAVAQCGFLTAPERAVLDKYC